MNEPIVIGSAATLYLADCIEVMKTFEENSIAAIVCDPPYLLSFMGKEFDRQHKSMPGENEGQQMQNWHRQWVNEAYRILKPGGYLAAFGGDRTHHRMLCAMEDAGFELRQQLYWTFSSGFPKNQDASKALDQNFKAKREVIGYIDQRGTFDGANRSSSALNLNWRKSENRIDICDLSKKKITKPETEIAKRYSGFGTALKPAVEIICCARKPMIGKLAENLLEWGTGAINIDGCRIPTDPTVDDMLREVVRNKRKSQTWEKGSGFKNECNPITGVKSIGRWPAQLILDGSEEVVSLFPVTVSSKKNLRGLQHSGRHGGFADIGGNFKEGTNSMRGHDDAGGSAARFFKSCPYEEDDFAPLFYSGKANKKDRDEGCEMLDERSSSSMPRRRNPDNSDWNTGNDVTGRFVTQRHNIHVSVKPTNLMKWLVRLLTPPGETVLDPFMGSGSTGKAALLEGFNFIGIEKEPDYFDIACSRIAYVDPGEFSI